MNVAAISINKTVNAATDSASSTNLIVMMKNDNDTINQQVIEVANEYNKDDNNPVTDAWIVAENHDDTVSSVAVRELPTYNTFEERSVTKESPDRTRIPDTLVLHPNEAMEGTMEFVTKMAVVTDMNQKDNNLNLPENDTQFQPIRPSLIQHQDEWFKTLTAPKDSTAEATCTLSTTRRITNEEEEESDSRESQQNCIVLDDMPTQPEVSLRESVELIMASAVVATMAPNERLPFFDATPCTNEDHASINFATTTANIPPVHMNPVDTSLSSQHGNDQLENKSQGGEVYLQESQLDPLSTTKSITYSHHDLTMAKTENGRNPGLGITTAVPIMLSTIIPSNPITTSTEPVLLSNDDIPGSTASSSPSHRPTQRSHDHSTEDHRLNTGIVATLAEKEPLLQTQELREQSCSAGCMMQSPQTSVINVESSGVTVNDHHLQINTVKNGDDPVNLQNESCSNRFQTDPMVDGTDHVNRTNVRVILSAPDEPECHPPPRLPASTSPTKLIPSDSSTRSLLTPAALEGHWKTHGVSESNRLGMSSLSQSLDVQPPKFSVESQHSLSLVEVHHDEIRSETLKLNACDHASDPCDHPSNPIIVGEVLSATPEANQGINRQANEENTSPGDSRAQTVKDVRDCTADIAVGLKVQSTTAALLDRQREIQQNDMNVARKEKYSDGNSSDSTSILNITAQQVHAIAVDQIATKQTALLTRQSTNDHGITGNSCLHVDCRIPTSPPLS